LRPEEADLAHRLQRLVVRLHRELRSDGGELGVSQAEAMALFDLRRHPGSGVSDLAAMGGVARSVMSERIKRLEALGFVTRDAVVRTDKRRIGLLVTKAGWAVLTRMSRERRDRVAQRLDLLTDDQRRAIEMAVDALDRLPKWRSAPELAADVAKATPATSASAG
jgi:DNA-binding MarR family transcriptional regulator